MSRDRGATYERLRKLAGDHDVIAEEHDVLKNKHANIAVGARTVARWARARMLRLGLEEACDVVNGVAPGSAPEPRA